MLQETRHFDVDTVDSDGDTPLHNACLHANRYIIKTILNTHININSPNNNAETPIHVACKLNNDTAVQMLREQNAGLNVHFPSFMPLAGRKNLPPYRRGEKKWPRKDERILKKANL